MKINQLIGTHKARARIPAQGTANTDESYCVLVADDNIKVVGARIVWDAAITGAATNHAAFGVVNKGDDAAGTAAVTAVKAYDNGVNAAAFVPEELTLGTEAARKVAAGDVLVLARTTPGTGLTTPGGVVEIDYVYDGEG